MAHKKLDIKNPCNQSWDEMLPMAQGRYCGSCNHIIHDFSEMTNDELLQMLQSGQYSCGMFRKDQIGMLYQEQKKATGRKKYWTAIAASILAGTLQLSMAYSQVPVRTRQLVIARKDILKEKFFIEGNNNPSANKTETDKAVVEKEKFSFRVVDSETKKPLPFVKMEMMGITGTTDSLGRVDFEFEYKENESISFTSNLFLGKYEEEKIKLNLQACYKKLTILYMRKKKKENKKNEGRIVGEWG